MTNEPSPRPWCIDYTPDDCVNIRNADGDIVARVDSDANAALIVDAVNERDRLRDIVRRLSRHLANYITSESENDLLREARAAIGEDAP